MKKGRGWREARSEAAGLFPVMGWESIDQLLRPDKAAASRIYHRPTIPVMATACYLQTETLTIFGVSDIAHLGQRQDDGGGGTGRTVRCCLGCGQRPFK